MPIILEEFRGMMKDGSVPVDITGRPISPDSNKSGEGTDQLMGSASASGRGTVASSSNSDASGGSATQLQGTGTSPDSGGSSHHSIAEAVSASGATFGAYGGSNQQIPTSACSSCSGAPASRAPLDDGAGSRPTADAVSTADGASIH